MNRDDIPFDDGASRLRVPPHSVEAEQSLLGGLMLDNGAFDRVCDLVEEGDFYSHENRQVFAAIAGLIAANKPADVVTVFERMQAAGSVIAGGLAYLNALATSVPGASNSRRYAEIVRERSVLRALIAACDNGATAAFNPQGKTAGEVVDDLATKLTAIEGRQVHQQPRTLGSVAVKCLDRISDLESGNVEPGWPTGFPTLDNLLIIGPGKVVVVAARPSVGKSSFAQHLGLHYARRGLPVLMLSQEMPDHELAERALSAMGEADYTRLQRGKLTGDEWGGVSRAVTELASLPFWVDDQPALRLADIRAKARMVKGLKVLVIDYVQLLSGSGKGKSENRNTEIEEITRGVKALAKQLGIAVILLSQLNRKVEERTDKRPQMSDLRDSGGIEQDADVVMFLWPARPLGSHMRLVGCEVAKQRGGPLGELALQFEGGLQRWRESALPLKGPVVRNQPEEFE